MVHAESYSSTQLIRGFIAGFLATLIFHQMVLLMLWNAGFAPFGPFAMAPSKPFGVPAVFSLAFWGGIWGIAFVLAQGRFPGGAGYWAAAILFGAVLPTAVALLLVLPLKGRPVGGGWQMSLVVTAVLVNGAWGLGTALIYRTLTGGTRIWRRKTNT